MKPSNNPGAHAKFPVRGWFADSAPDFRRELLALARPDVHAAGSAIYFEGDIGHDVFGVLSGVVTLQGKFTHPDALLLHMLRPGDWFGSLPVLLGRRRRVAATARTNVELLRVPGDELRALLQRNPEWVAELGREAIHHMDVAMQMAVDLLIRDASARCAAVLLRLAGRRWAGGPEAALASEIPASQAELAMLCNVSRNTFSRIAKELSRSGLLTVNYRSITVESPSGLRRLADGN